MGFAPITHVEVRAWAEIHGVTLTSWEVQTLFEMDAATTAVVNEKRKRTS